MPNDLNTADSTATPAPSPIEDLIARLGVTGSGQALLASLAQVVLPSYAAPDALTEAALAAGLAMATGPWRPAPLAPAPGVAEGGGAALPWLGDFASVLADDPLGVGEWAATTGLDTIRSVAERAGLLAPAPGAPHAGGSAAGAAARFLDPGAYADVAAPEPAGIMGRADSLGRDPLLDFRPEMGEGRGRGIDAVLDLVGFPKRLTQGVAPGSHFPASGSGEAEEGNGGDGAPPFGAAGLSLQELLSLVWPEVAGRQAATEEGAGGWPGAAPHDPAAGASDSALRGRVPAAGLAGGLAEMLADPVLAAAARLSAASGAEFSAPGLSGPASSGPGSSAPARSALGLSGPVLEAGRSLWPALPAWGGAASDRSGGAGPDLPGGATIRPADPAPLGLWAPAGSPDAPADGAHEDALSSMRAFLPAAASALDAFETGAFESDVRGAGEGAADTVPAPASGRGVSPYHPMLPPAIAAAGLDSLGLRPAWASPVPPEPGDAASAPDDGPTWSPPPDLLATPPPMAAAPAWPPAHPGVPLGAPAHQQAGAEWDDESGTEPADSAAASGAAPLRPLDIVLDHRSFRRAVLGYVDRECSGPATSASRPDPGLRLRPGGF